MSPSVTNIELEELLKAVGSDVIHAYRDKYFPARIIQACPSVYSIDNAASWVKPEKFCAFVAYTLQEHSPPPTPSARHTEAGSDSEHLPQKHVRVTSSGAFTRPPRPTSPSFSGDSSESGESDNGGTSSRSVPQKRKRPDEKPRAPKPSAKIAAGLIRVTRQCWVNHVETRVEAPENWRVPEAGQSVAYVLDLSDDPHDYKDAKGKALAMSAIIKHRCTDGWTGGSGGSLTKATTVSILGEEVKCQKMSHECRGSFVCSMAVPGLWNGYKRYDRDIDNSSQVWQTHNDLDETDKFTHIEKALRFYNNIIKEKCQFDNGRCPGRPVLKTRDQISVDGKHHFICCSAWTPGNMDNCHFSGQIPRQIDEAVVRQLFETGRNNLSNIVVFESPCPFQVPPRTGLKQKQCPHIHVRGGRITEGMIQHRPCPAKITIFSPVDHALRKAVVIPAPGVPHNHPCHPSDKLTRRAKAALRAAGTMEPTPGVADRAPATPIIDGDCLNERTGSAGSSNSLPSLPPESSVSTTTLLPSGHRIEQYY